MATIDYLNSDQRMNSIMRRYVLVRLLAHQKEIDQSWDSFQASSTSFPGIKRTTWVINQMMSQIDPSVVHPRQQSQGSPQYLTSRKQLTNQLAWAQSGLAVVALVLTDHDVPFNSSMSVFCPLKIWILLTQTG